MFLTLVLRCRSPRGQTERLRFSEGETTPPHTWQVSPGTGGQVCSSWTRLKDGFSPAPGLSCEHPRKLTGHLPGPSERPPVYMRLCWKAQRGVGAQPQELAACSSLSPEKSRAQGPACPRWPHISCWAWLPDPQLTVLWALLLLPTPDPKPVFIYSRKLWKVPGAAQVSGVQRHMCRYRTGMCLEHQGHQVGP